ncbi:MAG: tetratricopeptide repeat protein [Candidatus Poribacteria bacterium]|nr:tetratricopeptide repeat protein [Candidatus Poribacteria bacterium]MYK16956.1 tetratricopeptide repeat protein [Candidatus Poribacteria bacterium]
MQMKIGIMVTVLLVLGLTFVVTLVLLSNKTPSESTTQRTQVSNDTNNADASSGISLFGFIAVKPVISLDTCLFLLAAILAFIFARRARSNTTPELTSEDVSKSENDNKVNDSIEAVKRNPNAHHIDRAIVDAYALQRSGDIAGAIEKWDSIANVLEDNDKNLAAQALVSVGYLYVAEGKGEDGLSALDKAIALKPDLAEAYNNRGMAKNALGEHRGALADFDVAILLNPNYAEAYNNRGVAKSALGEHQDALADFDEAIRLKPDYTEAYIGRGSVRSLIGQGEAAINDYTEAIRLKPDYAEAYYDRGSLKRKYEQYTDAQEALSDYNEAIQIKPDYALAYANRGILRSDLGQVNEAKTDCETALELADEHEIEALKPWLLTDQS